LKNEGQEKRLARPAQTKEPITFEYIPIAIQWWRKRACDTGEWKLIG